MPQIIIEIIDGKACPRFVCEACQRIIRDAAMANMVWRPEEPNKTRIVCKECDLKERRIESRFTQWMELPVVWHWLGVNSRVDRPMSQHRAELMERMG